MSARDVILGRIRDSGPITVAEFMEIALYEPGVGYYARAPQRSGRGGDFFTSVDVGPLFGELVAVQVAEAARLLDPEDSTPFDLVEAAAGNGRLSKDILDTIASEFPSLYERLRLALVEVSDEARAEQRTTLGPHAHRLVHSGPDLPGGVVGVIVANELLDAMPVHVLQQTGEGLREVFVGERGGSLVEVLGEPSSPRLLEWIAPHVADNGLAMGVRLEAGMAADDWVAAAAMSLQRGLLLLFDYGHEASELLSPSHASGTLMMYRSHTAGARHWLDEPGENDLTSHVNLSAVRRAAASAGLLPAGMVDQTYFLLALGLAERVQSGSDVGSIRRRLAARTLMMPGGLGSTVKAMAFWKSVPPLVLRGFSSGRLS